MKRAQFYGLLSAATLAACVTAQGAVYSQQIVGGGGSCIANGTSYSTGNWISQTEPFGLWHGYCGRVGSEETFHHSTILWLGSEMTNSDGTTLWLSSKQLLSVPLSPKQTELAVLALVLAVFAIAGACWARERKGN